MSRRNKKNGRLNGAVAAQLLTLSTNGQDGLNGHHNGHNLNGKNGATKPSHMVIFTPTVNTLGLFCSQCQDYTLVHTGELIPAFCECGHPLSYIGEKPGKLEVWE